MHTEKNKKIISSPEPNKAPLLLEAPLFKNHSQIIHAFSTRTGGYSKAPFDSLNLSCKTGDEKNNVKKNIERLNLFLSIDSPPFFLDQVHGNNVLVADDIKSHESHYPFDAIITSNKEKAIVILTADCLPLLLYDPVKSVIAAIHAGWKGTSLQIAEKTVTKMKERFKSDPAHIIAAIGPAIGPCCYEVDHPLVSAFEGLNSYHPETLHSFISPAEGKNDRWMFDLARANRLQLLNVGLIQDNIDELQLCTCCRSDLFYSYRRDGKHSGRQGAILMIKESHLQKKVP
ncbi:MAG: peptidoglycan editing factor PgeF [Deltaproteobacteria bacterium]|nr:peptidoglycan editing factor PgeF [Deltaproteobacteria bacterium]